VGDRVVPGVHAGRHLAGPQQQLHRLALVGQRAGQAEMEGGGGDPSGVERPVGLDRLGGAKMQPLPAGQAEVPIQRLPGESVPERIGRLVQAALAAGAVGRFGERVTGLVGTGQPRDPVRGVVLAGGEVIHAPWVFGADGRSSTVARALGLAREGELAGELALLFAYWTGLPASEWFRMDIHHDHSLVCCPCEDGMHLVVLAGPPSIVHGDRLATYLAAIRRFPATLNPRLIDLAQPVSRLLVAPEPKLRGYFRQASGPGWALLGDAGHFKHPVTAQGIADAVEQAFFVADALLGSDPTLATYQGWRDAHAAEHYEWSYRTARRPVPERTHPRFAGLASDPEAAQEWRDLFTRLRRPSEVYTTERLARWSAAWQARQRQLEGASHA